MNNNKKNKVFAALIMAYSMWLIPNVALAEDLSNIVNITVDWKKLEALQQKYIQKYPALSPDGVILPQGFLLEQLRKNITDPNVIVHQLVLKPEGGQLELTAKKAIDVRLNLKFNFVGVDWKNRTILIKLNEEASSASPHLLGQVFGNLMLSVMSLATNKPIIAESLATVPFLKMDEKQMVRLDLRQVPRINSMIDARVFDYIGIQEIKTETGQIRVKMGRV